MVQLGNGRRIVGDFSNDSAVPVQVMGLDSNVIAISAVADIHTCAVHNGTAKCWGDNRDGKLGNGGFGGVSIVPMEVLQTAADISDPDSPIAEAKLGSGVTAISAGGSHTCALQSGAAKCWGINLRWTAGQRQHRKVSALFLCRISTLTNGVTAIYSRGWSHLCASQRGRQVLGG